MEREVVTAGKEWDGRGTKGKKWGKGNQAGQEKAARKLGKQGKGLTGGGWRQEDRDNQGGLVGSRQHRWHGCKVEAEGLAGVVGTRCTASNQQERKRPEAVTNHKVGHKQGGRREEGSEEGMVAGGAGMGEGQGGCWGPREGTWRSKN